MLNIRFRRNSDEKSATSKSTSFFAPSEKSRSTTATGRSFFSRKSTVSTQSIYDAHLPPIKKPTRPPPFPRRQSGKRSRSRSLVNKIHKRIQPNSHRIKTCTPYQYAYTYPASPFTSCFSTTTTEPPPTTTQRIKSRLRALRWKCHLIKFSLLLEYDRWKDILTTKLHLGQLAKWIKHHILRIKPEPRRPFFPRGPTSYELLLRERAEAAAKEASRITAEVVKEKVRRLSRSTKRSIKKACGVSTEQDELKEEDRRAMERIAELWRNREEYSVRVERCC